MMEAVDLNNAEMARWLVAKFPEATVTMDMVASTVYCGSLEVLQVIYGRSEVDPGSQSDDILEDGHTGVVEWLYTQFLPSPWQQITALDAAVCIGNVAMAEWLLDHGATWWTSDLPTGPLSITEELGGVEMLQWLDEHGRLKSIRGLVVKGAACRFIDAVYWLLDRGVKDSDEEEEFIAEIRFATQET
ncbi:hypothetical protein DVH05_001533 [Phytophthora capsici]|nr:hypothetical protein DVH05_001533 [Phytophthora capsici]